MPPATRRERRACACRALRRWSFSTLAGAIRLRYLATIAALAVRSRHFFRDEWFQRHNEFARLRVDRKSPSRRHHAEHGVVATRQIDLLTDNLGIAAKRALPESVPKHDHARLADLCFLRREAAAEHRLHTNSLEKISIDRDASQLLRLPHPA